MRVVLQRVSEASVVIENKVKGEIEKGFLILLGIEEEDTEDDISWLCRKIIGMRVFADDEEKMNLSVKDINGGILLISQFTLHASKKKGNRPSFIRAAKPPFAASMYEKFKEKLSADLGKDIASGEFGADMKVSLVNDGPVTLIIDSKNKDL